MVEKSETPRTNCIDCGYILDGLPSNRCPECGRSFDLNDSSNFAVGRPKGIEAARLVLQRGPRGAVLFNGIPRPYHVHACPIDIGGQAGAGATLQTVTTLSSAVGSDDRTSLRRGVAAATGQVAGFPLPIDLEELDVATAEC